MPGLGYLKPDQTTLTKFKAAYVSGPPKGRRRRAATTDGSGAPAEILPYTLAPVATGRRGGDQPAATNGAAEPGRRGRCSTSR